MDVMKIVKSLPLLKDYGKDVDAWLRDFEKLMKLWDINKPERQFIFIKECVNPEIQNVIDELKEENEEMCCPSLKEIKSAIEDHLRITISDKYWNLKSLTILPDENLSLFNVKYLRKYNELQQEYQKLINVDDYVKSIKERIYPSLRILEEECSSIQEAIKCSEKANRIEKMLNLNERIAQIFGIRNLNGNEKKEVANHNVTNHDCKSRKNTKKIMCFKCYELGHKVEQCPYSYRELVIMEENGKLAINKSKNYDPNYKKKKNNPVNVNNSESGNIGNNNNNLNQIRKSKQVDSNQNKLKIMYGNKPNKLSVNPNNDVRFKYNVKDNVTNRYEKRMFNSNHISYNNAEMEPSDDEINSNISNANSQVTLTTVNKEFDDNLVLENFSNAVQKGNENNRNAQEKEIKIFDQYDTQFDQFNVLPKRLYERETERNSDFQWKNEELAEGLINLLKELTSRDEVKAKWGRLDTLRTEKY